MSFNALSSSIRVLFWFSKMATRFSRHLTYSFFFRRHSRAASLQSETTNDFSHTVVQCIQCWASRSKHFYGSAILCGIFHSNSSKEVIATCSSSNDAPSSAGHPLQIYGSFDPGAPSFPLRGQRGARMSRHLCFLQKRKHIFVHSLNSKWRWRQLGCTSGIHCFNEDSLFLNNQII